jgi:hypothetical protein
MLQADTPTETPARAPGAPSVLLRALWVALCALALALGGGLILLGAGIYASARAAAPVRVDGYIADYREVLVNGAYGRNELVLANDPHTYALDKNRFHPPLPARFAQDARISIWVDKGTPDIVAVTLYDLSGLNPATYTTPDYDNPRTPQLAGQAEGVATAAAGAALLVGVLILLAIAGVRRRSRAGAPRAAPVIRAAPLYPQPAPLAPGDEPPTAPVPAATAWDTGGVDQVPTQRIPAVQPGADGAGAPQQQEAGFPERGPQTGPLAPPAELETPPATLDDLPTQRTPAIPAGAAGEGEQLPVLPRFGPERIVEPDNGLASWGAAGGWQPPEQSARPTPPIRPRLVPADEPAAEPAQPAPPDDCDELPTEKMPSANDGSR